MRGQYTNFGKTTIVLPPATYTVTNKALTSNVATITTSAAHGYIAGDVVQVSGVDAIFNTGVLGVQITAVTSTTFSYAKTNANVAPAAASGYTCLLSGGTAAGLTSKVGFPPAGGFYAICYPAGQEPTPTNTELLYVNSWYGDAAVIYRGQGGQVQPLAAGWNFVHTLDAGALTQIERRSGGNQGGIAADLPFGINCDAWYSAGAGGYGQISGPGGSADGQLWSAATSVPVYLTGTSQFPVWSAAAAGWKKPSAAVACDVYLVFGADGYNNGTYTKGCGVTFTVKGLPAAGDIIAVGAGLYYGSVSPAFTIDSAGTVSAPTTGTSGTWVFGAGAAVAVGDVIHHARMGALRWFQVTSSVNVVKSLWIGTDQSSGSHSGAVGIALHGSSGNSGAFSSPIFWAI